MNDYVAERDAALSTVGEIRAAEVAVVTSERALAVKAGDTEAELRAETARITAVRDRLQSEWQEADLEIRRQRGLNE